MTSEYNIARMQLKRYEIFKAQEPANFDVTFEVHGKLIYANKYVLETISTTFQSMLSQRWKSKADIIKLDTYSYDNFYEFLTFIYSGTCDLTDENVLKMVDMAEFYNVEVFKDFCDEYISEMKYDMENILDLMELVTKYSLPKSKAAINTFIYASLPAILQSDKFMSLEKSFIELLLTFRRNLQHEEQFFEAVYKWAENQIISDESPAKRKYVNIDEGIKAELSTILPHINFDKMTPEFFYNLVATKNFLFSPEKLSTMLCDFHKITVFVYDGNNTGLSGSFLDNWNICGDITRFREHHDEAFDWYSHAKPSKPSNLKKNENVQFYFVLSADQHLKVKKRTDIIDSDYLICEMKGDPDFAFDADCYIHFTRKCFE